MLYPLSYEGGVLECAWSGADSILSGDQGDGLQQRPEHAARRMAQPAPLPPDGLRPAVDRRTARSRTDDHSFDNPSNDHCGPRGCNVVDVPVDDAFISDHDLDLGRVDEHDDDLDAGRTGDGDTNDCDELDAAGIEHGRRGPSGERHGATGGLSRRAQTAAFPLACPLPPS